MSRFVFVIGTGRCGSTLIHDILARHPDLGFVSNLDDRLALLGLLGRWNNRIYRATPEALTRKGRPRIAPAEAYRLLRREVSPVVCEPFRDLTEKDATPWLTSRLRRFFEVRAEAQGRPVFSHKFTGWPRARLLRSAFPDARFINVVRDGRAVANSWVQMEWWSGAGGPEKWRWGPLPAMYRTEWEDSGGSIVALAGLQWKLLMDAFQEAKESVPPSQWIDVRYEDVLRNPRRSFGAILGFAGLDWSRAFQKGFDRYRFRVNRAKAYRIDLRREDVRSLESSLAEHLTRWGYSV